MQESGAGLTTGGVWGHLLPSGDHLRFGGTLQATRNGMGSSTGCPIPQIVPETGNFLSRPQWWSVVAVATSSHRSWGRAFGRKSQIVDWEQEVRNG